MIRDNTKWNLPYCLSCGKRLGDYRCIRCNKCNLTKRNKGGIGKKLTPKHCKKIGIGIKKAYAEGRRVVYWKKGGHNAPHYGHLHSQETKDKIKLKKLGQKHSKETIKKILRRRLMSGLEVKVDDVIKKHRLPYKFVGNGGYFIGRKNPDFINTNGRKIAVEVYCRQQKEKIRGVNVDEWKKDRIKVFNSYGWKIIYIEDWQTNKEETILNLLKC